MGGQGQGAVAAEAVEEPVQVVALVGQGTVDVLCCVVSQEPKFDRWVDRK